MHKIQVPGSGSAVHTITVHDNKTVSCSCPAWRNQSLPPDLRTCKHIKAAGFTSASLVATRAEGEPVVAPTTPVIKEEPPVLLAHPWDNSQDLSGWWMSEKYDGVRSWWDGENFTSRQGNLYNAPTWFIQQLPKVPLDGELWMGRKLFQETVGAVRKHTPVDAEWSKVKYMVFDLPKHRDPFETRQKNLITYVGNRQPNIEIVPQVLCRDLGHLRQSLQGVLDQGGEGLMMRQPGSLYESGRSNTLLKVKRFFDAEAVVTGYEPGKGRHKGRVGALMAVTATGVPFKIGTGLSDREREKPPAIGSRVTYRYQELTKDSVPRFPSFVCVRDYE